MRSFKNAQEAFEFYFDYILNFGEKYRDTLAIFNEIFEIKSPFENEINTPWRNWKKDYAQREWEWYLSKNRNVKELSKYAKLWNTMHSGDFIVNSNYGYLWSQNNQLDKVINILINDNESRRAVITLYDGKDIDNYKYDTPCTLNISFFIKNSELNMNVVMRSNDLIYGFCNDQYCFSNLMKVVYERLKEKIYNLKVGKYYHFVFNFHIYERHFNLKNKNKK